MDIQYFAINANASNEQETDEEYVFLSPFLISERIPSKSLVWDVSVTLGSDLHIIPNETVSSILDYTTSDGGGGGIALIPLWVKSML